MKLAGRSQVGVIWERTLLFTAAHGELGSGLFSVLDSTAGAVRVIKAKAKMAVPSTLIVRDLEFFMSWPLVSRDPRSAADIATKQVSRTPLASTGANVGPIA
ncbi:hypothetical protein FXV83_16860 [Bradyrhizobium hipponense]|uniref:Uncharacterized protein n=1 Tax=Bradyrhizobium hipponense TaxID=2605638 RepID=A0A5S4YPK9_9BRAD|nr:MULTISPECIES: hypothetical protein [Bradyrhizobium]TYO65367.1 hypothetical protein FXV83_16860 [Bradyrhizobium hipponense]